ncbi:hypothetical protein N9Z96_00495 [bacterium]|nr:hypothetical protein [bacterium]
MGIEALHETTKAIAQLGRFEDDFLAHVAKGEMVVPGDVLKNNPKIKKAIFDELKKLGVKSPSTYIVGSKFMRINPLTGQPEFFLKKIFQRAKKAVRDIGSELKDNDLLRTALPFVLPYAAPFLGMSSAVPFLTSNIGRNVVGAGIGALSGQNVGDIGKDLLIQNAISGGLGALNAGQGNRMTGFTEGFNPLRGPNATSAIKQRVPDLIDEVVYDSATGNTINTGRRVAQGLTQETPGLFDRGIETVKNFMVNPDETGLRKYSGLISTAGVAAAMLAAQQAGDQLAFGDYVYDPAQNVYLKGNQTIDQNTFYNALSDFYDGGGTAFGSETGSPVGYAKGGGTEFPRKTGMIDGPGTGQSDSIPAMLSDGEFVITKQAVVGLGNGSRDKGTKKLYSFMDQMEDKAKGMGIGKL